MSLPTFQQLTQPISDYHQFLQDVNRMASLPADQQADDPGIPLRYRFVHSANEQPAVLELDQQLRNVTHSLDEFLLLPVADYPSKMELLLAIQNKLMAEMALGLKVEQYLHTLVQQHAPDTPLVKHLHAGKHQNIPRAPYYRAVALMNETVAALNSKLSTLIAFMKKHRKDLPAAPLQPAESTPASDRKSLLTQPFLTKKEAAMLLNVSEDTIDNYIKRGLLRKTQVPGRKKIAIPVADVKKLFEG